ncbi:hypothetical protein HDU97_002331 [Phlyctochytrium planicorne]|nr:hypothetical protein HDU97_002331 [Phlyctochytrium planicorne]
MSRPREQNETQIEFKFRTMEKSQNDDSFSLIFPFVCEFFDIIIDSIQDSYAFLDLIAITLSSISGLFLLLMVFFDPSIYPFIQGKPASQVPASETSSAKELEVKIMFASSNMSIS